MFSRFLGLRLGGSRIHTCGHPPSDNLSDLGASEPCTLGRAWPIPHDSGGKDPRGMQNEQPFRHFHVNLLAPLAFDSFEVPGQQVVKPVPLFVHGCFGLWRFHRFSGSDGFVLCGAQWWNSDTCVFGNKV